MAQQSGAIEAAYHRIRLLKIILSAERSRAESDPFGDRNVLLGITMPDQPKSRIKDNIKTIFNELELLLDHLTILHMAASFEMEATARLGTVVGEARKTIESGRKPGDRWPSNLVRDTRSFEGLHDIETILSLAGDDKASFRAIRLTRNGLSHGVPLRQIPTITADEAKITLVEALEKIK